jgi:dTDP-4-amino-4,6-dideoxygalactose transaminase
MAIDPDGLRLVDDARALVIQHTFGLVDAERSQRLAATARASGALVVEDSAHCATTLARTPSGTPLADVSVHSFGVEKLLPTRFGGAVWVNPELEPELRASLANHLTDLPGPGPRLRFAIRTFRLQVRGLARFPASFARLALGLATRLGLHEPAIADIEVRGGLSHPPLRPSRWVNGQMERALRFSGDVKARRLAVVTTYLDSLARLQGLQIPTIIKADTPLVRFPVLAPDARTAEILCAELTARGHYITRWYRPALFPGVADPAVYNHDPKDEGLANTRDLIDRIINLPTTVSPDRAQVIVDDLAAILTRVV